MDDNAYEIIEGDCLDWIRNNYNRRVQLTFFDPPYNQGKEYTFFKDNMPEEEYWDYIKEVVLEIFKITSKGGAIYFMHREKNTEHVLKILREIGWNIQNLIIWKKSTSPVPIYNRFSLQYQIIVYALRGKKPRTFNRLRVDIRPPEHYHIPNENGYYVTDIWEDIDELTSGFFAGDEAIRDKNNGKRAHLQQSPISLLLRIILSSSKPGDTIFDPMAGTGTASVVAYQLDRKSISIEIDPKYVELIKGRLKNIKLIDDAYGFYNYYKYTPNLKEIWSQNTCF